MLREGRLPVRGRFALRDAELSYADEGPRQGEVPFAIHSEVSSARNPAHQLMRIGVKGREIPRGERPASNLVFLLDVSGSMSAPDKLLLKEAFKLWSPNSMSATP